MPEYTYKRCSGLRGTGDRYARSVRVDNGFCNRKSKAVPAFFSCARLVNAVKTLKNKISSREGYVSNCAIG